MSFAIPASWLFDGMAIALLITLAVLARRASIHHPPPSRARRANIYRCEQCNHVYVDARVVPLSRCARCRTLNEAIRR